MDKYMKKWLKIMHKGVYLKSFDMAVGAYKTKEGWRAWSRE